MRVLHFINNIDLSWYTMLLDTIHAQQRRGHEVIVVVPPGGKNYRRLLGDGVDVIPLNVRSSKFDYVASAKLAGIIRERGVDVLHTHLTSSAQLGSAAAKWSRRPCVASVLKMTRKNRYMKCDMLLPCSDAVMEDLLKQNVPVDRMRRVYTGIDFGRYFQNGHDDESAREEFGFDESTIVFGTIARLVPMKGHKFLLDAFKVVADKHPEARLLIVGDGELRPLLEAQAEVLNLNDRVVFAGTRTDLKRVLNAIDVSVLASVEKEGLPVILVESALVGKPVIMSDVAGIREVIRNGVTGLLVTPEDVKGLAAAMCDVIENPDKARKRAEAALEFVRREFDVERTTAQIDEVYAGVLGAGEGGSRAK